MKKIILILFVLIFLLCVFCSCNKTEFKFISEGISNLEEVWLYDAVITTSVDNSYSQPLDADEQHILYTEYVVKSNSEDEYDSHFQIKCVGLFDYLKSNAKKQYLTEIAAFKFEQDEYIEQGLVSGDKIVLLTSLAADTNENKPIFNIYTFDGSNAVKKTINLPSDVCVSGLNYNEIIKYNNELLYVDYSDESTLLKDVFTDKIVLNFGEAELLNGQIKVDGNFISAFVRENNKAYLTAFKDFKQVGKILLDTTKNSLMGFCTFNDEFLISLDRPANDITVENTPEFIMSITEFNQKTVNYSNVNISADNGFFGSTDIVCAGNSFLYSNNGKLEFIKKENDKFYKGVVGFLPYGCEYKCIIPVSENEYFVYIYVYSQPHNSRMYKLKI